jgi:hypothetical protein
MQGLVVLCDDVMVQPGAVCRLLYIAKRRIRALDCIFLVGSLWLPKSP